MQKTRKVLTVTETPLKGILILEPRVFNDNRGYFLESYSAKRFEEIGIKGPFVQDNQSYSTKGSVRGLHFQAPPHAQGKLVRVTKGRVIDVVVDIRKSSQTYGQHYAVELSADNFKQMWIPTGFAHGFSTISEDAIFQYKCTDYYNGPSEGGILWSDPDLGIDWQVDEAIVSDKDKQLPRLKDFESPFN